MVAVPSPLSVKVTPLGNVPVVLSEAVGLPAEITVKEPAAATVKVVLFALVICDNVACPNAVSAIAQSKGKHIRIRRRR